MKAFKEPAKLADRVIASGDGVAEPGVTTATLTEPAKLATDVAKRPRELHFVLARVNACMFRLWPTSWAGQRSDVVSPGSAAPSPGAITLSASFAG